MRWRRRISLVLLVVTIPLLSACSPSRSADSDWSSNSTETASGDILTRLNAEGTYSWEEDRFAAITETQVEHIYFGGGCAVWVFPSYGSVEATYKRGFFDFYRGEVWYGEDSYGTKGVALLTEGKDSRCAQVVFTVLNWSVDESTDEEDFSDSTSMEGKWGSYSWMEDQVGAFLIVKSAGGDRYVGTFYTQGQSGGVFKDSMIDIVDLGDGMAEVTWPSGNTTIAAWGKRDAQTGSNMDPSWMGDIWFDCIGELDFAESRADCDFYLVKG